MIRLLFGFEGRINRGRFWLVATICAGLCLAAIGLAMMTGSSSVAFGVWLVAIVLCVVCAVAAGIKRLHDRNKSPWWLLLFYGGPLALPFAAPLLGDSAPVLQYVSA